MLTETVIFRATAGLANAIQQKAEEEGLNLSEYLRAIAQKSIGASATYKDTN